MDAMETTPRRTAPPVRAGKSPSTGALTPDTIARQDRLYESNPGYDVLIVGIG